MNVYKLLEIAEEAAAGSKPVPRIASVEDAPPVLTVQQQQADQMKVYWKVHHVVLVLDFERLTCLDG